MLPIVTAPNEVLAKQAKKIDALNKQVQMLIEDMKQTLANTHDPEGVGLAAPQVGKSVQLFIAKPNEKTPVSIFINPVVVENNDSQEEETTKKKKTSNNKLEGCLSVPSIWGFVNRKPKITITYQDEKGKQYTKTFTGFMAIIIQHEMDHLNGILFPKHVLEQNNKLYKSHKDGKEKDVFEEIEV